MTTFRVRPGITVVAAAFNYEPIGGRYDLGAQLAAGGGTVTETNEGLIGVLTSLTSDPFGTSLLLDQGITLNDNFSTRFADRTHRRRR